MFFGTHSDIRVESDAEFGVPTNARHLLRREIPTVVARSAPEFFTGNMMAPARAPSRAENRIPLPLPEVDEDAVPQESV